MIVLMIQGFVYSIFRGENFDVLAQPYGIRAKPIMGGCRAGRRWEIKAKVKLAVGGEVGSSSKTHFCKIII